MFQSFIDQGIDLSAIKAIEPTFASPPKLDGNHALVLEGSYPTTPSKVSFQLKYLDEKQDMEADQYRREDPACGYVWKTARRRGSRGAGAGHPHGL